MKETGRYRHKNEPCNSKCKDCKAPIWVRTGIHTVSGGHAYYSNDMNNPKPESILVLDGDRYKAVCNDCYVAKYEEQYARE